jgi:hypothetical protein
MNALLVEQLARERHAQWEREIQHARLLRKATRGRRAWWAGTGTALRRAAAGCAALAGRWLVRTGTWLQSSSATPISLEHEQSC